MLSMSTILKVIVTLLVAMFLFGVALPWLVSQPNTELAVGGVVITIIVVVLAIRWLFNVIAKQGEKDEAND